MEIPLVNDMNWLVAGILGVGVLILGFGLLFAYRKYRNKQQPTLWAIIDEDESGEHPAVTNTFGRRPNDSGLDLEDPANHPKLAGEEDSEFELELDTTGAEAFDAYRGNPTFDPNTGDDQEIVEGENGEMVLRSIFEDDDSNPELRLDDSSEFELQPEDLSAVELPVAQIVNDPNIDPASLPHPIPMEGDSSEFELVLDDDFKPAQLKVIGSDEFPIVVPVVSAEPADQQAEEITRDLPALPPQGEPPVPPDNKDGSAVL